MEDCPVEHFLADQHDQSPPVYTWDSLNLECLHMVVVFPSLNVALEVLSDMDLVLHWEHLMSDLTSLDNYKVVN